MVHLEMMVSKLGISTLPRGPIFRFHVCLGGWTSQSSARRHLRWHRLEPWVVATEYHNGKMVRFHSMEIQSLKSRWRAVPTYWFIFGPFTNLPFGICAIYFHLKVQKKSGDHQLIICSLSHHLQGFIHPKWCRFRGDILVARESQPTPSGMSTVALLGR